MRIRKADINDTEVIVRVALNTWKNAYRKSNPDGYVDNIPYKAWVNTYKNLIFQDDIFVYVAESNAGQIIGFAAAGPERHQTLNYRGELYAIYVLNKYHRKGIGSLLLHAIFNRFKQLGIYSVMVVVLGDNPYKGFYETCGGEKITPRTENIKYFSAGLNVYGWPDIRNLPELSAVT